MTKHLCIGCLEWYDENLSECPFCLTPQTACACRCDFIFPDFKTYVEHRKAGCMDVGINALLKKRIAEDTEE